MKSLAKYIAEAEQTLADQSAKEKQQRLAKVFGEDISEGFSDVVKGIKRKIAGKPDPKAIKQFYLSRAQRAVQDANKFNTQSASDDQEKHIDRYHRVAKVVNKEGVAEATGTFSIVFYDAGDDVFKTIATGQSYNNALKIIKNNFKDMYDTGDRLRKIAPNIYVHEVDYENTGERATPDNYEHMYHWIIKPETSKQGVAEGEGKTQKYEMMMRNGQIKRFTAKDDADAKRIAAGHGAKSVIRMKGNVPGDKIAEQGVAEGGNIGGEQYDMEASLRSKSVDELNSLIKKLEGKPASHAQTHKYVGLAKKIRAEKIGKKGVSEGRLLDEAGSTLDHILNRFKHEVRNFEETGDLDDDLYYALFDYYSDSGEMPYGVAKARTGDPIAWVSERLEQALGVNEALSGPKLAPDVDPFDIPAYKRVGGRHGGLAKLEPSEPAGRPRPESIPAVTRKAAGRDFPVTLDQVHDTSDSISSLDTLRKMAGLPSRA